MKIYYAHCMCIYGSDDEEEEINFIKLNFPNSTIIDPGFYANNLDKQRDGMEYCKNLVSTCDGLIFTRLLGKVTAGVGLEIHHALEHNKQVYELKNGKIKQVKNL